MTPSSSPVSTPTVPRRRWRRRVMLALIVLVGSGALAIWTLTRSHFVVGRVTPILSTLLGGEVKVGHAALGLDGRLTLSNVRVRAPGVSGAAGRVAQIDRLDVRLDRSTVLDELPRIERVDITGMRLRLAEDEHEAGSFSFMALRPQLPEMTDRTLPPIRINMLTVETGVRDGDVYVMRGERMFCGDLRPIVGAASWYDVALIEIAYDGTGRRDGIVAHGQWNVRSNEHALRIESLQLDDRLYEMCPRLAQLWLTRMELSGRFDRVEIGWQPESGFQVQLEVEDVGLTLPLATSEFWARYQDGAIVDSRSRPRMAVRAGTITLRPDRVALSGLQGALISAEAAASVVGVPYQVSVIIEDIPPLDWTDRQGWMDRVIETAPFAMRLSTGEFRLREDAEAPSPGVELPRAVARVLERFQFRDWVLETTLSATRAAPDAEGRPATIRTSGQAYIRNASGAYEGFPYLLQDVRAYLEFDNETVRVHELTGHGSDGVPVRLTGRIHQPGPEADVDMHLEARGLPLDAQLREALGAEKGALFDEVMHEASFAALDGAGLLAPAADGAVPFALGGTIDLELDLLRDPGPDQPARIEGEVTVERLGLLYRGFPYPITIRGGTLRWAAGVVTIADEGLVVSTPGGGRGRLRGAVRIEPDGETRRVVPDLSLSIRGDRANALLHAAIPPGADERAEGAAWPGAVPSRGGAWLADLGIQGALAYEVVVSADDDGAISAPVTVTLDQGTIRVAPVLARALGRAEAMPTGWDRLDSCTAVVVVDGSRVAVEHFEGRLGEAVVTMEAAITVGDESIVEAALGVDGLRFDGDLLDLLPEDRRETIEREWTRYRPTGTLDAQMTYWRRGTASPEFDVTLRPRDIELIVDDVPVRMRGDEGTIVYEQGRARFEGLVLAVEAADRSAGRLVVDGAVTNLTDDLPPSARLDASWLDATLESPLTRHFLTRFGPSDFAESVAEVDPMGVTDVAVHYDSTRPDDTWIEFEPEAISFMRRGERVAFAFEDGRLRVVAGRVDVQGVRARMEDGVVHLNGTLETGTPFRADLAVAFAGRITGPVVRSLLPDKVGQALDLIQVDEDADSVLTDGHLVLTAVRTPEGSWRSDGSFDGVVDAGSASFVAGVPFRDVEGAFDLDFAWGASSPTSPRTAWRIQARPRRAVVFDRLLTDLDAVITTGPDQAILLEDLRARCSGGLVTARARSGTGDDRAYDVSIRLVGVDVAELSRGTRVPSEGREFDDALGEMYASLDLRGTRGEPARRIGRGNARAVGRRLAAVPVFLRLMPLLHMSVSGQVWDYADATFFLVGDEVSFERLMLESAIGDRVGQQLIGEGTYDLASKQLDLRFRSRGGLAVVSDVVGQIGDQLAAIVVTGTLDDPVANFMPIPMLTAPRTERRSAPPLRLDRERNGHAVSSADRDQEPSR